MRRAEASKDLLDVCVASLRTARAACYKIGVRTEPGLTELTRMPAAGMVERHGARQRVDRALGRDVGRDVLLTGEALAPRRC